MTLIILVAPYWNVNFTSWFSKVCSWAILVAPYWNVNYVYIEEDEIELSILVAPYWNVNYIETCGYGNIFDISSTILE